MNEFISWLQSYIFPRHRIHIKAEVAIETAIHSLEQSLKQEIVLSGRWQRTRRYWGNVEGQAVTLHGPKAYRQFCFLTRGYLTEIQSHTILDAYILVSRKDCNSLALLLMGMMVTLPIMFQWASIFYIPFFSAFIYVGTLWHLHVYSHEIFMLLAGIMKGHQVPEKS